MFTPLTAINVSIWVVFGLCCESIPITIHGKILEGKQLANCELFAKIFLTNITDTPKTYLAYGLTVACSPNFFLANSFYLYGSPKFSPAKYFLCMVVDNSLCY